MMKYLLSTSAVTFLSFAGKVHAFPTQAGACSAGITVGGSHATRPTKVNDTITASDFQVLIDGNVLDTLVPYTFILDEDHEVTVEAAPGTSAYFRGFLVRIGQGPSMLPPDLQAEPADTTTFLAAVDDSVQVSEKCLNGDGVGGVKFAPPVGGVTHVNNTEKTSISALLRANSPMNPTEKRPISNLEMDVTVVVQNRNTTSEFYYDRFILNGAFPECNICADDSQQVCDNDAVIDLSQFGQENRNCGETFDAGILGFLPPLGCGALQGLGPLVCDCQVGPCPAEEPTETPISEQPSPPEAPSTPTPPPSSATQKPTPAPSSAKEAYQLANTGFITIIMTAIGAMMVM